MPDWSLKLQFPVRDSEVYSPHRRIHCHEVRRTKKSKKPPRSYSFSWKRKKINSPVNHPVTLIRNPAAHKFPRHENRFRKPEISTSKAIRIRRRNFFFTFFFFDSHQKRTSLKMVDDGKWRPTNRSPPSSLETKIRNGIFRRGPFCFVPIPRPNWTPAGPLSAGTHFGPRQTPISRRNLPFYSLASHAYD